MARALLPLLAVVWIDSAAGCVGMAAAPGAVESRSVPAHEHALHVGHAHDAAPHGGGGEPPAATNAGEAPSARGDAARGGADPADAHAAVVQADSQPVHEHGECPHCPDRALTKDDDGAPPHVACDTAEAATADARSKPYKSWETTLAPPPLARFAPAAAPPGADLRICAHPPPVIGGPRLNVQHCVFLL
ncbi:MAG: hypothetical protein JXB36_20530 [Gammaproteobacteria bacterium]|nr:hypothetical protein [Gammaproteobacteria bacterium]